jgi:hypothetical protein
MAKTNSKYFEYRKNLLGVTSAPSPIKIKVANSTTVKVGQMVRVNTAGFIVPNGAANPCLGRVAGLIDNNGIPVNAFQYDSSKTGHTNSGDDTVITASDNQTRTLAVYAEIEVGLESILFYNDANGDFSDTNILQFFDLVSTSDQIDQSTALDTNGVFQLVQLDPDGDGDLSKGLFKVNESQLHAGLDSATSKIVA